MGYPTTRVGNLHRWREEPEMMMSGEELEAREKDAQRPCRAPFPNECCPTPEACIAANAAPRCPDCGVETAYKRPRNPADGWTDDPELCRSCWKQAEGDAAADVRAERAWAALS